MAHTMTESNRLRMVNKVITGAKKYKNKLIGKEFFVVCDDGSDYNVRFFAKDFIHLTGIKSDLSDERFFDNSSKGILSMGNILESQKYDWNTLKGKTDKIENIDQIMYGNSDNSLFMINLHTNTGDYPVAIRNSDIKTCVGFRDDINRARTLRKYNNSGNADDQKEIIAIFAKIPNLKMYNELVYLKDSQLLMEKRKDILEMISDDLKQVIPPPTIENKMAS